MMGHPAAGIATPTLPEASIPQKHPESDDSGGHDLSWSFTATRKEKRDMPTSRAKDGTEIYYKDWGAGQPVVFSHGWPLTSDAFEDQMLFLSSHGYRTIAHDRRGHGRSSQPWVGNDMDTYADDLAERARRRLADGIDPDLGRHRLVAPHGRRREGQRNWR